MTEAQPSVRRRLVLERDLAHFDRMATWTSRDPHLHAETLLWRRLAAELRGYLNPAPAEQAGRPPRRGDRSMSLDRAPRIGLEAEDRKTGMTLDELTNFVSQAHHAGTPSHTPVHAVLGWRQQIQSIETRPDKDPR